MSWGELISLIVGVATVLGTAFAVIKAFIKMAEKNNTSLTTVTDKLVETHKEHAEKLIQLTKQVIETNERNTSAFKENAKSNDALVEAVKDVEKVNDQILQNFLNTRGPK